MLYFAMGDGGGADDRDGQLFTTAPPAYPACGDAPIVGHNQGNAQTLTNPLGKIHRIDVDGSNSANGRRPDPRAGAAGRVLRQPEDGASRGFPLQDHQPLTRRDP
jgi:hypothetical protein